MSALLGSYTFVSFARWEVVAPAGLWERGSEALASGRVFPLSKAAQALACVPSSEKHRAPKAFATSPSGETGLSSRADASSNHQLLPIKFKRQRELDTVRGGISFVSLKITTRPSKHDFDTCTGFRAFRILFCNQNIEINKAGVAIPCTKVNKTSCGRAFTRKIAFGVHVWTRGCFDILVGFFKGINTFRNLRKRLLDKLLERDHVEPPSRIACVGGAV